MVRHAPVRSLHCSTSMAHGASPGDRGSPPGPSRREIGSLGERLAARHLERRGLRVVERNVRCRLGEIDLVALSGGTVVFVEVKGKRGPGRGLPEEMVTAAKRRRLTFLAQWYLQRRGWLARPSRFDVVAVDWCASGPVVRHIPDAFPAATW